MTLLDVKNLKKVYTTRFSSQQVVALSNVSFSVEEGEYVAIMGESGSGKTTLLNILAGLDQKSGGIVKIKDGLKIGYMLQEDALFPWLNILNNACLGLDIQHIKTPENVEYVKSLLIKYGLKDFLYKHPRELSGGMRQRVG